MHYDNIQKRINSLIEYGHANLLSPPNFLHMMKYMRGAIWLMVFCFMFFGLIFKK